MSKQFTAFALLLLEQQGKLKLDDPVVKYLPELSASAHGVTLRHLVHHTGGLRDYIEILYMKGRGDADGSTIDETVRALARQSAPNEKPGVEFDYSNTGYFLLGVVIARVSGQSLAEFSAAADLRAARHEEYEHRRPLPGRRSPRSRAATRRQGTGFVIDETGWEQVGDGQVHSDLHDLALWDENFYTGKVGGRELVARMYEVGLLNSGKSTDYAAGLNVDESRGLTWVTHGGSWVGYRSSIVRVPDEHFSVIVLCNRADADAGGSRSRSRARSSWATSSVRRSRRKEDEEPSPGRRRWHPRRPVALRRRLLQRRGRRALRARPARRALVLEACAEGAVLKPGKPGEFVTEPAGPDPALRAGRQGRRQLRLLVAGPARPALQQGQGVVRVTHCRLSFGAALSLRRCSPARACGRDAPTSTLIVNASIVDGTGAPARQGAVRIDGDRIVEVGALEPKRGETRRRRRRH